MDSLEVQVVTTIFNSLNESVGTPGDAYRPSINALTIRDLMVSPYPTPLDDPDNSNVEQMFGGGWEASTLRDLWESYGRATSLGIWQLVLHDITTPPDGREFFAIGVDHANGSSLDNGCGWPARCDVTGDLQYPRYIRMWVR